MQIWRYQLALYFFAITQLIIIKVIMKVQFEHAVLNPLAPFFSALCRIIILVLEQECVDRKADCHCQHIEE